jgi:hypothetical protein
MLEVRLTMRNLLSGLVALLLVFGGGYWYGKEAEYNRQQAEIAALNAKARETEKQMAVVATTYADTLRKSNKDAEKKITTLRAAVASGDVRLSIPTQGSVCSSSVASITTGDNDGETRAELDRSVGEALIAITAEGDTAIRKLNACIETYNTLRNMK